MLNSLDLLDDHTSIVEAFHMGLVIFKSSLFNSHCQLFQVSIDTVSFPFKQKIQQYLCWCVPFFFGQE